ncbi:tetratricopeptide repeat protein [Candidatus Latescibacterota bacterium]
MSNRFALDDDGLIQNNRFISEGTTIKEIFTTNYRFGANNDKDGLYRPLVMLSYVLNAQTLNPVPFHFINVLINSINAVLLFFLIYVLTGNQLTGFITALIFSFHPIHTEAVANISGRPELMCAFFMFISFLFLEQAGNRILSELSAAFFLFLALLSKETAVMLPFIIIFVDFALNRNLAAKHMIRKYSLLFTIVIAYIIIRWLVLGDTMTGNEPMFLNNPIANSPVQERIATALTVMLRYIILLLMPLGLSSDYSYNTIHVYESLWHLTPLFSLFLFIFILTLSFYYRKNKPTFFIAFIFFLFPYLIVSNIFFPIGTIMGERLMYLPSVGYALMLGALFTYLLKRWRYSIIVIIIILFGYSLKTYSRNADWYDDYTLTKKDFKRNPKNVKLIFNMGYHAFTRKQYDIAETFFNKSLEIYPDFTESLSGLGKMFYNQKQYEKSLNYYAKSKQLSPNDPEIIFDYAAVLINMGRFDEAESELVNSLKSLPDSQLLYRCMGNLKYSSGDYISAIENYELSLKLGGDKRLLIANIAAAYYLSGDYGNARKYVRIAESDGIRINPELVKAINAAYNTQ